MATQRHTKESTGKENEIASFWLTYYSVLKIGLKVSEASFKALAGLWRQHGGAAHWSSSPPCLFVSPVAQEGTEKLDRKLNISAWIFRGK